jgi:eukaryotic-like serine/threonine-protein kinase
MDAARWHQIEDIFHTVVDLPIGPERETKLTALCGTDEELVLLVRGLLAEEDQFQVEDPVADPHIGLRLGHYEVDALIARGGMASVYGAHRADDTFQQRVAIKIMDLRLSEPALVAQFRAERQILAALEHPALTRLLDGGVTGFGEPYLVMEYVEGEPIDQYCDRERLGVAARIRLFMEVCAGVAFAHRNLVLHRDIKPGNILITADGHVKVVDFGTATLLRPERLATVSRAPLTPAYASPEQLKGDAVGTASDQYSLGLVLYQLLTGVVPFALRASLMAGVERAISGEEPTLPHNAVVEGAAAVRQTTLSRLRRVLAGDLGTIVRKALSADPAARYASVQHFAEDLERWEAGAPIHGRTPSLVYQTSRLVKRHWVPVTVAATLLVSLIVATAVSIRQARIARAESAKAVQLNRFLTRMLSSANPSWSNANAANAGSITVRQVLDGAGALVTSELGSMPEVEAEMRRALGQTYVGLGAPAQAHPQLERALALYREQSDAHGIALTTELLGNVRMQRGEFKAAEVLLREVIAYLRARGDRVDPEFLQSTLSDLAAAIAYQHPGHPEALALMRESIAAADRAGSSRGLAAVVQINLGSQLVRLGRIDEGEATLNEARRRVQALPTELPEANSLIRSLGIVKFQRGDYVEAERLTRQAVEGSLRMRPPDHPLQPNFKIWWGRTLLASGQIDRGREVVLEAVAGYRKIRPPDHLEMALPLITLGIAHRLDGKLEESESVIREARAILAKYPSSRDRDADAAGELGLTLRAAGRHAEAETLLKESYALLQELYGEAHPLTQQARARVEDPK